MTWSLVMFAGSLELAKGENEKTAGEPQIEVYELGIRP
jgi:hypothetical protein